MAEWVAANQSPQPNCVFDTVARLMPGMVHYAWDGLFFFLWQFASCIVAHYERFEPLDCPANPELWKELRNLRFTRPDTTRSTGLPSLPQSIR